MKKICSGFVKSKKSINFNYLKLSTQVSYLQQNHFNFHNINSSNFLSKSNSLFCISKMNFSKKLPKHTKVTLPSLSPSMEKGGIVEWKVKEGQAFVAGQSIAGIETDKAVVDFEMNEDGYLAKIIKPNGTKDISLGTVIFYFS